VAVELQLTMPQSAESDLAQPCEAKGSCGRVITMILADIGLVLAQVIFFITATTNDKALGLPMLLLSVVFVLTIGWAAFTARRWLWLRVFNSLLLVVFVIGWVVLIAIVASGPD
jgi:hypothetical protein